MPEPLTMFPTGEPQGLPSALELRGTTRRTLLRRLLALLAAGGTAFALTTWVLVRYEDPLGLLGFGAGPSHVVKAQLEALNRGELRAAYEMFSPHYRQQVSFEAFRHLVATHRGMFRTRELRVSGHRESGDHAVLETHLLAESGERYRVRFTLVRAEGHWWIDDLRWGSEANSKSQARLEIGAGAAPITD
jgi:uncharacterized protein DUF4864